jgi:hypothetical protein
MKGRDVLLIASVFINISFIALDSLSATHKVLNEVKECFYEIETGFSDTIGEMSTDDPYLIFKRTEDMILTCLISKK